MRTVLTSSIVALGMLAAAPAFAQGVYVGPGGVGVDTGIHPYGYDRRADDQYGWHHRRDRHVYEGRSAYPERNYDDQDQ